MGQATGGANEEAHCYYCFKTFTRGAIEEYDELLGDAMCPFCGIDSVVFGPHTAEDIHKLAQKAWAPAETNAVLEERPTNTKIQEPARLGGDQP